MPKFRVSRTSLVDDREQAPCAEAVQEETVEKDLEGAVLKVPVWVIDVNTLDELITFRDKYGELLLECDPSFPDIPDSIEINDTLPEGEAHG